MEALIILVVFVLGICSIPIGIAYWANASRKSKRKQIEASLPATVKYKAAVRINTDRGQGKFMKMKAFEYAALLYVNGDKICITGTGRQHSEFDMRTASVRWVGIQAQNGALEWFNIKDDAGNSIFVNGETGILVFNWAKTYPSTRQIYSDVMNEQSVFHTPPPAPGATPPPAPGATPPPAVPKM